MRKLIFGLMLTITAPALAEDDVDLKDLSYGIGVMIQGNVLKEMEGIDLDELLMGLKDAREGKALRIDMDAARALMHTQQAKTTKEKQAKAREEGEAYLAENAKKAGVKVTASGLQYEVLKAGNGPKPKETDRVTVHYQGTLLDGTEFDSSYSRGEPATFALNRVIKGWTEGVQLMTKGSKYRFVIPPDLAYGKSGAGAQIGPDATLVFEVELIDIKAK